MPCFDDSKKRLDNWALEARKLPYGEQEFALGRIRLVGSWENNAKRLLLLLLNRLAPG
jgi:hypothetical protein